MKAQEELHLRIVKSPYTPERAYYLTLAMTGDDVLAERIRAEQWLKQDRAKVKRVLSQK